MPENTLDEMLAEKHAASAGRQAKELALWETAKKNDWHPDHLEPLLDLYAPLIERKAQEFGGRAALIPKPALKAELMTHVIGAFKSYNPARGAAINTHVTNRIQKAKRFVAQHQNIAYIPEPLTYQIGTMQRATDALSQDLGRAPDAQEIADHLGWKVKTVSRIQKSMFNDIPGSSLEQDPMPKLGPREEEVLALLPSVLTEDEKAVFDHIYHSNPAKRVVSTSVLAKKLNKNPSQISRIKSSIITKAKGYI